MVRSSVASGLLALTLLTHAGVAQGSVWVVDDQAGSGVDFTNLQTAIDTVASGDVLLVKPGTYAGMSIQGKAITIHGDSGGTVLISQAAPRQNRIAGLPAGQSVHLRNLGVKSWTGWPGLELSGCAGSIWMEGCTLSSPDPGAAAGLVVSACSDVVLIESTISAGDGGNCSDASPPSPGMLASSSSVHSYGCRFDGASGGSCPLDLCGFPCFGWDGSAGVRGASSFLFFSDSELVGGGAGPCHQSVGPHGGAGLELTSGQAFLLDSSLQGGPASSLGFGSCPGSNPGPAYTGAPVFLPGEALRATMNAPVREHQTVSVHLEGPPLVPVWRGLSNGARSFAAIDLLRGVVLPDLSSTLRVEWLGITSATGILDVQFPVGALPSGVDSALEFWQFYYLETPRLPGGFKVLEGRRTPKSFVLGAGTMRLALDETF